MLGYACACCLGLGNAAQGRAHVLVVLPGPGDAYAIQMSTLARLALMGISDYCSSAAQGVRTIDAFLVDAALSHHPRPRLLFLHGTRTA